MPKMIPAPEQLPRIKLPKGRDWVYFLIMSASAALFGGLVLNVLHAWDPLG